METTENRQQRQAPGKAGATAACTKCFYASRTGRNDIGTAAGGTRRNGPRKERAAVACCKAAIDSSTPARTRATRKRAKTLREFTPSPRQGKGAAREGGLVHNSIRNIRKDHQ